MARQSAMGMKTDGFRRMYPEIAMAFDLYCESRIQSYVTAEVPKGNRSSIRIVSYTSGYGNLPAAGGLLDQSYRMMELWSYFLEGDRLATKKALS